jgi:hypothetical protein
MKSLWKKLVIFLAAAFGIAALIYAYLQMSKEPAAEAGDQAITAQSKVRPDINGDGGVNLDPNTQKLVGLQTAPLAVATLKEEVKAYGRTLDPTPLVGLVGEMASSRAALAASSKDYRRVKALFGQEQNASAKALETAEATMKHDQIALDTAKAQLTTAWGVAIADQSDLANLVASLSKLETVVVRLDLPSGEALRETPTGARLIVAGRMQPIEVGYVGRAPTVDPQSQGEGFLFMATNSSAWLAPGLALTGFLSLPGEPLQGVIVPGDAVVRWDERAWVYTQSNNTNFTRHEISVDHPVAAGWFVTHGVTFQDRVVVMGAQVLLSEERKTEIKTGD